MADHALAVGIQSYPGLGDLQGPCDDATRFRDWLVRSDGGVLDSDNVDLVLSTDFPPPSQVFDARPILNDIENHLRPLITQAALGQKVGERFFFFLAGHGLADPNLLDSAGLFVANAEPLIPFHCAATHYVDWFRRHAAFDQIFLIMDCCRANNPLQAIAPPMLPKTLGQPGSAHRTHTFYAFATGWGQLAREKEIDGQIRGIFTSALLDALDHAPPNQSGRVTGSVIKNYIHNTILEQPPEIKVDSHREVVFAERPASGPETKFVLDPFTAGVRVRILFGGIQEVTVEEPTSAEFTLQLPPGLYKVVVEGTDRSIPFEVPANDDVVV